MITREMIERVVEAELDDALSNSNGGAPSIEKQRLLDAEKVEAWAAIEEGLKHADR